MPRRKEFIPLSDIHTFQINHHSSQSLYREVYFMIRQSILSGRTFPGTRLPSTRCLAKELKISRNTILTAYEQLWAEGFVEFKKGSGTYVCQNIPDKLLQVTESYTKQNVHTQFQPRLSKRGRILLDAPEDPWSKAIPFAPGIPALDKFPTELWARITGKHWRHATESMLSYAHAEGHMPLRKAIAQYLKTCRAVNCEFEQIVIVSGAQQALDLITRILLDPGDLVWMEDPGYHGSRGAFTASGAKIAPIPVDQDGLKIDFAQKKYPQAKLVYLTPSHQYPTGITMSLSRRLEVIKWASENNMFIVEDDYDSEYRYHGTPIASMQGLCENQSVIYIGTFSKVLFPSLRLGYIVLPSSLIKPFVHARHLVDRHPPSINQAVLCEFISEGHFSSHIRKMRILYEQRQNILFQALQDLKSYFYIPESECGMHLVAYADDSFDDIAFAQKAIEYKIQVRPLSSYYIQKNKRKGLVLGYAGFDEHKIIQGVKILKKILSENSFL